MDQIIQPQTLFMQAFSFWYGIEEKNEEDIIRIGDQGKRYGNDFQMLNCIQGFSVDEIEPSTLGVLPIIGESGNRILGINATKKILDDLIIEK